MCFPLNCIPCFLSGGDEKQTFTTAGYSHLSNSRGGGNKPGMNEEGVQNPLWHGL